MAFKISNSTSISDARGLTASQISMFPHSIVEVLDPSISPSAPAWGTNYTFAIGGSEPSTPVYYTDIDRFPFAADNPAVSVGAMSATIRSGAGNQSQINGYHSGGDGTPGAYVITSAIQKFAFSSPVSVSGVGNLTAVRYRIAGASSATAGYCMGGIVSVPSNSLSVSVIDKFPFVAEYFCTFSGDLTANMAGGSGGVSSTEAGYATGGINPNLSSSYAIIQKFKFANDGDTIHVGDLTTARGLTSSASSPVAGYTMGGLLSPTLRYKVIDKFPYTNEGLATTVGDLSNYVSGASGSSSTTNGYLLGGLKGTGVSGAPPIVTISSVDKFPFASDTNATYVLDLARAKTTTTAVVD